MKENIMDASTFLVPENFITGFDTPARAICRYEYGLFVGNTFKEVHIGYKNVWGASLPHSGTLMQVASYEKIGFHANTADLLRGFLDSSTTLIIHRMTPEGMKSFRIVNRRIVSESYD